MPPRYTEEQRQEAKEKRKLTMKEWKDKNKEEFSLYQKQWYLDNKERLNKRNAELKREKSAQRKLEKALLLESS
jgi:alpha-galactosidase/6-phospho-beta-glucosidase family protein